MDAYTFLKHRTDFIRHFYDSAAFPFSEKKRKIETQESPFEPSYSEDGEPPFLVEWIEADESLEVLGQVSISLLASTLQLYLKEWESNFRRNYGAKATSGVKEISEYKSIFNKHGCLNAVRFHPPTQAAALQLKMPVGDIECPHNSNFLKPRC